ncbi:MAG: hypothetical protein ABMA64_30445 [Myxococcota bacterium]
MPTHSRSRPPPSAAQETALPAQEYDPGFENSFVANLLGRTAGAPQDTRITSEDVIYEQLAHRVIYQGALRPDDQALFAQWGYDPNWRLVEGAEGLQVALILPAQGSTRVPVIVFRGTEPAELADLKADLAPEIGQTQYDANREVIDGLFREAGRCDVIGHSLGASLAQRAAVEHPGAIRRVVGFQAPGIDHDRVEQFERQGNKPEVTYHLAEKDMVDLGGEEHLPGTFFTHKPKMFGSILGSHVGYLLLSPQYRAAREEAGLTDEVLDRLDADNADLFGVEHDVSSLDEVHPADRRSEYWRPDRKREIEELRKGLGGALAF